MIREMEAMLSSLCINKSKYGVHIHSHVPSPKPLHQFRLNLMGSKVLHQNFNIWNQYNPSDILFRPTEILSSLQFSDRNVVRISHPSIRAIHSTHRNHLDLTSVKIAFDTDETFRHTHTHTHSRNLHEETKKNHEKCKVIRAGALVEIRTDVPNTNLESPSVSLSLSVT
jgi:hypothetical protein